ncbi:monooxygenase 1-like [Rhodamnia argentea]|uniref:Monooxygenase 1-like n=1 Tax=Rhodamnia argentea TaxID=178133 RepID=A0ABM3H3H1_9MYRT|nr:monooxygenase 1-like [Rhodamnia argentea]
MNEAEERDIVIVGGGICGLATALALHRKGIRSLVLERSEGLRATGAALTIRANGWRALDHLGLGSVLRKDSFHIDGCGIMKVDRGTKLEKLPLSKGEARCIKRSDLVEALAKDLPQGTVRFGCHVISVKLDPVTSSAVLELHNGFVIKAKVLIGCDGVNSAVLKYLHMNPTKFSATSAIRGFTSYPEGHEFENLFIIARKEQVLLGRVPVNDTLVYWFVTRLWTSIDSKISENQQLIKMSSLETIKDFPEDMKEMIKNSDRSSLSCLRFRYRAPWDLMLGSFSKGTVTVAGDALHAMSPFIGQGGSASLEDAVVLARCLAQKILESDRNTISDKCAMDKYEEALNQYGKERRMRLIKLSTQSYLQNKMFETSSMVVKLFCIVILAVFFRDSVAHSQFDCGHL